MSIFLNKETRVAIRINERNGTTLAEHGLVKVMGTHSSTLGININVKFDKHTYVLMAGSPINNNTVASVGGLFRFSVV